MTRLAKYVRRLVTRDLSAASPAGAAALFDLGSSGRSDVAEYKDTYVGHALQADNRDARV